MVAEAGNNTDNIEIPISKKPGLDYQIWRIIGYM